MNNCSLIDSIKSFFSRVLLTVALSIVCQVSYSQVTVEQIDVSDLQLLLDALEGDGVELSNITFKGGIEQVGLFNDPVGIIGLSDGIILGSGDIRVAEGPNLGGGSGTSSDELVSDSSLEGLTTVGINDIAVVEFDLIPFGNKIAFQYVLASEEYTEDDESFPDPFGLWISGPGIVGEKNIAIVPNTNDIVSTGTINDRINSQFFNSNGEGFTPFFNQFLGYDGYTDVLTAFSDVIPCQQYHIKIAIADARDQLKDSGVFVEQGSFTSTLKESVQLTYESPLDTVFESCAGVTMTFQNSIAAVDTIDLYLDYFGTTNELDFDSLPSRLSIYPGQTEVSFFYEAINDNVEEGVEELEIKLSTFCGDEVEQDSLFVQVKDYVYRPVPDYVYCDSFSIVFSDYGNSYDNFIWEDSDVISCTSCLNPQINLFREDTITYQYQETVSGCLAAPDSFIVSQFVPSFDMVLDQNEFFTVLDVVAHVKNGNLDWYEWRFPNETVQSDSVIYQVADQNLDVLCVEFEVEGFYDSLSCSLVKDTVLCIEDVLLVPNVVTPNGDGKNDLFEAIGFVSGNWDFKLYNRFGVLIFSEDDYQFDYDPKELSDGVYFYELTNKFGDRQFVGWLQVIH